MPHLGTACARRCRVDWLYSGVAQRMKIFNLSPDTTIVSTRCSVGVFTVHLLLFCFGLPLGIPSFETCFLAARRICCLERRPRGPGPTRRSFSLPKIPPFVQYTSRGWSSSAMCHFTINCLHCNNKNIVCFSRHLVPERVEGIPRLVETEHPIPGLLHLLVLGDRLSPQLFQPLLLA